MYAVHPFRQITSNIKNKSLVEAALAAYRTRRFKCNDGWCQDVLDAALLGAASEATEQVIERSLAAPAKGYKFKAFAAHDQDYPPSLDQLNVMRAALQWMILAPRSTSESSGPGNSITLFPAWNCSRWDVKFKLHAPMKTVVEGELRGGMLVRLDVSPALRRADVVMANCGPLHI
jgi:hypothetical protein